jgi:hypothetical protein
MAEAEGKAGMMKPFTSTNPYQCIQEGWRHNGMGTQWFSPPQSKAKLTGPLKWEGEWKGRAKTSLYVYPGDNCSISTAANLHKCYITEE